MNSDNHFRSVPFGGFNKEDVLKYIEQIKTELVVYRNNSEQQIQELVKRIEVLETQLNASNAKIKEYESIIHENRNISEKRAVSSSPFNMSPIDVPEDNNVPHLENEEEEEEPETSKTNEGQIHDEFKTGGFRIEDAILLEQDGSKFNAENTQEAQAGYAVPEPEKGIAEEERVPGGFAVDETVIEQESPIYYSADEDDEGIEETPQAQTESEQEFQEDDGQKPKPSMSEGQAASASEENNKNTEENDEKTETGLFKKKVEQVESTADSITKAQDSVRELGVILASFGISKEIENSEAERITDSQDVIDSDHKIKDEQNKNNEPVSEKKEEKKEYDRKADEYSDLERFLNFAFDGESKISEDELDKLTDRFAGN